MRVLYSVVCTRHDTAFVQIRYRDSCRVPRDSTDTVWTAMDRRACKRKEPGLDYKLYSYRNSYCNSLIRNPDQSFLVSLLYADIRYEEERKTGDGSADNSFGLNDSAQCTVDPWTGDTPDAAPPGPRVTVGRAGYSHAATHAASCESSTLQVPSSQGILRRGKEDVIDCSMRPPGAKAEARREGHVSAG